MSLAAAGTLRAGSGHAVLGLARPRAAPAHLGLLSVGRPGRIEGTVAPDAFRVRGGEHDRDTQGTWVRLDEVPASARWRPLGRLLAQIDYLLPHSTWDSPAP